MDHADKPSTPTGQSAAKSTVHGHVVQVAGIGGSVQISLGSEPGPARTFREREQLIPYLLLEAGRVIGPSRLRAQISQFLSVPKSASCVLLLIGIPGVGKSALAWDAWKLPRSVSGHSSRRQFWYSLDDGRDASVNGDLTQVRGVKGKVRLRRHALGGVPARLPESTGEEPLPGNGQSVTGAQVAGDLDRIDDVGSGVALE